MKHTQNKDRRRGGDRECVTQNIPHRYNNKLCRTSKVIYVIPRSSSTVDTPGKSQDSPVVFSFFI